MRNQARPLGSVADAVRVQVTREDVSEDQKGKLSGLLKAHEKSEAIMAKKRAARKAAAEKAREEAKLKEATK